jgi:hypothetical protein
VTIFSFSVFLFPFSTYFFLPSRPVGQGFPPEGDGQFLFVGFEHFSDSVDFVIEMQKHDHKVFV